jgi:murein DD-endopeptidase MepM/ murein hydrolase activator NlpD
VKPTATTPVPSTPATVAATTTTVAGSGYWFPVSPSSVASYGHAHHDYPATDVFAPCGTAVVAVTAGVISEVSLVDRWDPATNLGADRGGLSISLVGDDGVRYYGSHLSVVTEGVAAGVRVQAGQLLGKVGNTGDAAGIACHLHFGLSPPCGVGDWDVRRGVIYPWPYLDAWKAGQPTSPATETALWARDHSDLCPGSG